MIDLNVRVLTELSLRFADSLVRHKGGILNVASVASFMPGPGMAVYHATKAYVLSFSEALHRELGAQGVRVTALCPGPVETEFMARAGIPDDYFPQFLARSAERVAQRGLRRADARTARRDPGLRQQGRGAAGAAAAARRRALDGARRRAPRPQVGGVYVASAAKRASISGPRRAHCSTGTGPHTSIMYS